MSSRSMTRRRWIGRIGLAAGSAWALGRARSRAAAPPADAIRVAVAGLRNRGRQLLTSLAQIPDARLVALCDPDETFLRSNLREQEYLGRKVAVFKDPRKLLEHGGVDALIIATPDHWHALLTIWACQAGWDVFVEKPVSYCIEEGRRMLAAAEKYNRIVAAGTQNRSDTGLRALKDFLDRRPLGRPRKIVALDHHYRTGIGRTEGPQPIPPGVDYDVYQGPALLEPLRRKNLHYDWHWFWSTGTGECGNWGAHTIDQILWLLGIAAPPRAVWSLGGRFAFDDDGQTPNTQVTWYDCGDLAIVQEIRNLSRAPGTRTMDGYRGLATDHTRTMWIEFEEGRVTGGRGGAQVADLQGRLIREFPGDSGETHLVNFFEAVRDRAPERLRAPLSEGHLSAMFCHLANISYRCGRPASPEEVNERIGGAGALAEFVDRLWPHLRAHGVDPARTQPTLGVKLALDPAGERCVGEAAAEANALFVREYRAPYVLPEV